MARSKVVSVLVMVVVALCVCVSNSMGAFTLNWSYSGNIQTWDPTIQVGWAVRMYIDNSPSGLSDVTFAAAAVPVAGGTTGAGDVAAISPYRTVLTTLKGGTGAGWTLNNLSDASIANQNVYTVIFNNADTALATKFAILDSATKAMGGVNSANVYSITAPLTTPANTWKDVVPEPGVMSLMAMGASVLALRRRIRKI